MKSSCCGANLETVYGKEGTSFYLCLRCMRAADVSVLNGKAVPWWWKYVDFFEVENTFYDFIKAEDIPALLAEHKKMFGL